MRISITILSAIFLLTNACAQTERQAESNALKNESSPYLLQHANNPVNWYPWGDEAFKKAKSEGKLLIISIGYAACHWCHVMEHESFEDSTVAAYMNQHFISIKVDREERPDVDQVYMNAAQLLTGRGGWPLNAVALPDGRPFFAGTYLPKDQWMQVLQKLVSTYQDDADRLQTIATQVTEGVQSLDQIPLPSTETNYDADILDQLFQTWMPTLDFERGGQKGAPKFPMPVSLNYLMQYYYYSGNEKAKDALLITLEQMGLGGIYDHLGGGFARYAIDAHWKVPHFEKMLYDNAQLVSLYSHAFQLTKDSLYRNIVYETLEFIKREMTSDMGAFYSSLDADSEGEEGKYYVWSAEEIEQAFAESTTQTWLPAFFNISATGNWEHGNNILYLQERPTKFAEARQIPVAQFREQVREAKKQLLVIRSTRSRPGLDDKVLTSWNAMMLNGYIDAYRTFNEEQFLSAALKTAKFLQKNLIQQDGSLMRNYKDGKATITGFLDDYAFLIKAYLNLYEATFDETWLYQAKTLTDYVLIHFQDDESPLFFYTSDQHEELIARQKEIADNVIPASNSVMANNLYHIGTLFYDEDYLHRSKQMLDVVYPNVVQYPNFYANWASLLTHFIHEPYEVAIVGNEYQSMARMLDSHYLPSAYLLGGQNEGSLSLLSNKFVKNQTTIYVCQNKICQLPVTSAAQALQQIK